jgi:hypothetical protein
MFYAYIPSHANVIYRPAGTDGYFPLNCDMCRVMGVRGSVVVKALCYKPEGRGFETR